MIFQYKLLNCVFKEVESLTKKFCMLINPVISITICISLSFYFFDVLFTYMNSIEISCTSLIKSAAVTILWLLIFLQIPGYFLGSNLWLLCNAAKGWWRRFWRSWCSPARGALCFINAIFGILNFWLLYAEEVTCAVLTRFLAWQLAWTLVYSLGHF